MFSFELAYNSYTCFAYSARLNEIASTNNFDVCSTIFGFHFLPFAIQRELMKSARRWNNFRRTLWHCGSFWESYFSWLFTHQTVDCNLVVSNGGTDVSIQWVVDISESFSLTFIFSDVCSSFKVAGTNVAGIKVSDHKRSVQSVCRIQSIYILSLYVARDLLCICSLAVCQLKRAAPCWARAGISTVPYGWNRGL